MNQMVAIFNVELELHGHTCWHCFYSYLNMLQCIGVIILCVLLLGITCEVQGAFYCLLNPGAVKNLEIKLDAKQNKYNQKVMELEKMKNECDSSLQRADSTIRELVDSLQLELAKCGECDKQLRETRLAKDNCEELKCQQAQDIAVLKSFHNQLDDERTKNKKLTAELLELQSRLFQVEADKAWLEKLKMAALCILFVIFMCNILCYCCRRADDVNCH